MRRGAPVVILGILLALLLGSYIVFSQRVVMELRRDASRSSLMHARILTALADPSPDAANAALLDLASSVRELGVPVIITDQRGRPVWAINLPFETRSVDDPRVREHIAALDRENPPIVEPAIGTIHFGDSPLVKSLRFIPALQALLVAFVFLAGVYVLRTRGRADRERVWAGMARESAHQLATPLSSLAGWIELLADRAAADPTAARALDYMRGDLDRLERIAHRFERIGRPARETPVDVAELAERVAKYFQARVPTLAHTVDVKLVLGQGPLVVKGDAVLLEWALEAITKNALDALAGRGGTVELSAMRTADDEVRVRVADDGPGIPRDLRARVFEPGFSTKESGWGIGLSLARRIIEEAHGGRLELSPSSVGATFDVILPG
ncbi:MAG: sensor histidine kinase [Gemmatimonadaceae bacterium]